MRSISVDRDIDATRAAVWNVLADFPNIASWNSGVKKSFSTSDSASGVGAQRHCDLAPAGELEETVTDWVPEERMIIGIDSTAKLPIARGSATFRLTDGGDSTPTTIDYQYETKWGPLGKLMGPLLDKQLSRGFNGFLEDLETAAKAA